MRLEQLVPRRPIRHLTVAVFEIYRTGVTSACVRQAIVPHKRPILIMDGSDCEDRQRARAQ